MRVALDIKGQFLDSASGLSGQTISSLIIVGIMCLLSLYIALRAHFADPLKKPKGILFLAEVGVTFFDNLVSRLWWRDNGYCRIYVFSLYFWFNWFTITNRLFSNTFILRFRSFCDDSRQRNSLQQI